MLNFQSPYHVGWRTAEPIIEGLTIHRSIIYTWIISTGNPTEARSLAENLSVSAALPTVATNGCHEILLPLPPIPSRVPLKKKKLRWITVRAVLSIAQDVPYIENIEKDKLTIYLGGRRMDLCYTNEVVHQCDEKLQVPQRILERVDVHSNRIDRVTNAADVYKVSAYRPLINLGVVLQGEDNYVDKAVEVLNLLGELGVGGIRSRGYGRFTTEIGKLCNENFYRAQKVGRLVILGSYLFSDHIDYSKSLINKRNIAGFAGPPHDAYILPYVDYIGSGSIIYAKQPLKPKTYEVKTSSIGALLVFNPVTLGAES